MVFFFISLVTYISYLILKTKKALIGLNKKNFKKYIFNKKNFLNLELLGIILIIMTFFFDAKVMSISMIILYMILSLLEIKKMEKLKFKKNYLKIIVPVLIVYLIIFTIIGIDYHQASHKFLNYNRIILYYPTIILFGYLLYPIIYFFASITKSKK